MTSKIVVTMDIISSCVLKNCLQEFTFSKNNKINPDQSKQGQNISVIKALTHD